jgi:DNA helicase-2/ATP-dependent DNA helicase PcrA
LLFAAADEREEAAFIADELRASHGEGRPWSDHVILYRLNAQSNTIETALASARIPYKVVGGTRFFDHKEIRDIIAYLSVLHNPSDALRLGRIINEPKRGIGDATLAAREIPICLAIGLLRSWPSRAVRAASAQGQDARRLCRHDDGADGRRARAGA